MSKKTREHFVFAYGSNMNPGQMERRCPGASFYCVGRLEQNRLKFVGWSDKWDGGVATVEEKRRAHVLGVVWRMPTADLERLDVFEGVPFVYDRVSVPVKIDGHGKRVIWCETYVQIADELETRPSALYLKTILDGYEWIGVRPADSLLRLFERSRLDLLGLRGGNHAKS